MSGNLKLNTTSGGSIALTPENTASTITVTVPAVNSTLNTSGAVNTVPAGSVSAPAITTTGDTNTGIFFPAADTIAFTEGGVESMRIDSSGNVGIGVTPNAWGAGYKVIQIGSAGSIWSPTAASSQMLFNANSYFDGSVYRYINTNSASDYFQNAGSHTWRTAPSGTAGNTISFTQAMTLADNGNLGIGTTSTSYRLYVRPLATYGDAENGNIAISTVASGGTITSPTTIGGIVFGDQNSANSYAGRLAVIQNNPNGSTASHMRFYTNGGGGNAFTEERMRLDSSGNLLVGVIDPLNDGKVTIRTPSSFTGTGFRSDSNTAAGTTWNHFYGTSSTNSVANIIIFGNGNIQNANNSYGALSDSKLKENIVDATPKLEKLNQVRVVNFNLIGDEQKQLGVIAQELEQIFPGMIDETIDRDAEGKDLGTTTKSVKYSVFVPMLIKAIQEQQALITQLQADVATLKGAA